MSVEAPPRRGRPPKSAQHSPEVVDSIRATYMSKGSPETDYPRLELYQNMGYEIAEEAWRYKLQCSQSEYDERQKGYQTKGLARAGIKSVSAQNAADQGLDRSASITRLQTLDVSAADLLDEETPISYDM